MNLIQFDAIFSVICNSLIVIGGRPARRVLKKLRHEQVWSDLPDIVYLQHQENVATAILANPAGNGKDCQSLMAMCYIKAPDR